MKLNMFENKRFIEFGYHVSGILLSLMGWKIKGKLPHKREFVLIGAPHSSDWDFIFFILMVLKFKTHIHWMARHTMFISPFKKLLVLLGGIPIDRSVRLNTVDIMTNREK